jgi:hypothetical protein
VRVVDADWTELDEEGWTAIDAGGALLGYATAIAERGPSQVTTREYRAAHERLLGDPAARRAAGKLLRLTTPELMWSYLRSVATGGTPATGRPRPRS